MPTDDLHITLELEGLPQERGHVRFNDLLAQLNALKQSLDNVDKGVESSGHVGIYYRVVGLSYASPVRITLEPVSKPTKKLAEAADITRFHHRFFETLSAISDNKPIAEDIDTKALLSFRKLVEQQDKKFLRAIVYNKKAKVALDKKFKDHVSTLIDQEYHSYGSLMGKLEAINLHGEARSFWIFPEVGPSRVLCKFMPGDGDKAVSALRSVVEVRGRKSYRPGAHFPYRIDVRDFETVTSVPDSLEIADLGGIVKARLGEKSSAEFIRDLRDEWN